MESVVQATIPVAAVVGTGVIGRSWIQVFTRARCHTRVYDRDYAQVQNALSWLAKDLATQKEQEFTVLDREAQKCRVETNRLQVRPAPAKTPAKAPTATKKSAK